MSETTANVVDEEVSRMMNEAHDRARGILEEHRELLDKLSKVLMTQEVIDGEDLLDYVEGRRAIPTIEEAEAARDQAATEQLPGPVIVASPTE